MKIKGGQQHHPVPYPASTPQWHYCPPPSGSSAAGDAEESGAGGDARHTLHWVAAQGVVSHRAAPTGQPLGPTPGPPPPPPPRYDKLDQNISQLGRPALARRRAGQSGPPLGRAFSLQPSRLTGVPATARTGPARPISPSEGLSSHRRLISAFYRISIRSTLLWRRRGDDGGEAPVSATWACGVLLIDQLE